MAKDTGGVSKAWQGYTFPWLVSMRGRSAQNIGVKPAILALFYSILALFCPH